MLKLNYEWLQDTSTDPHEQISSHQSSSSKIDRQVSSWARQFSVAKAVENGFVYCSENPTSWWLVHMPLLGNAYNSDPLKKDNAELTRFTGFLVIRNWDCKGNLIGCEEKKIAYVVSQSHYLRVPYR
jgi:hypothetical protein